MISEIQLFLFLNRITNFRFKHHATVIWRFAAFELRGEIGFHYEIKSTFFHMEMRLASGLRANI